MWKQLIYLRPQITPSFQLIQKIGCPLLETETSLAQQVRTTFVLKRKWPPGLHKKNQKPKKLSARHFVYELEEDTNIKKQDDLTLILTNYVEGLGHRGDKVSVRPNYGYHKLLLPGLAVYASPENLVKYANHDLSSKEDEEKHSSPYAQRTVTVLSTLVLAVVMNKEVPWKLEPWHIRTSFRKAGVHLPEEAIEMPLEPITGPNLSIESKSFNVTVTVNDLEKVKVECRIHHWGTQPSDRLPYVESHWTLPTEAIFSDNKSCPPSSPPVNTTSVTS